MKAQTSTLSRVVLSALVLWIPLLASEGDAHEEYADATGTACRSCHVDPLGGGGLTQFGQGYSLSVSPDRAQAAPARGQAARVIRALSRYVHILTAILWFGTILYVHLVLKPAYASKGLPRGEVRLGLGSMAVMALTGVVLVHYRVPSLDLLLSSTFGLLLVAKIAVFTIMVVSALFVVLVIGPRLRNSQTYEPAESGDLTPEQLSGYDGAAGRPAYIGYRGKVYDVSHSLIWFGGTHLQRHQAGRDLTEAISQAPHGEDYVLAMPEVGVLSEEAAARPRALHERVFYLMAYMNLGAVLIIALILALWRL